MNTTASNKYSNFLDDSLQLLNPHWHEENVLTKLSLLMSLRRKRQAKTFFSYYSVTQKCQLVPKTGEQLFCGRGRKLSFSTDGNLHPGGDLSKSTAHNRFQDTNTALTILPQDSCCGSSVSWKQPLKTCNVEHLSESLPDFDYK